MFLRQAGQRCRACFVRDAFPVIGKGPAAVAAATIRTIFAQTTAEQVRTRPDVVADMPGRQFPQVEATLPEATGDSTAFADFPAGAREEDLVSEPFGAAEPGDQTPGRRRPRSAPSPVCPDPIALDRLTAAVLAEHHHGWQDFDRRRLCEGSSRNSAPRARPTPAAPSPRNRTSSTGHTTRWDTADLDAARVRSACVCQHADPRTGLTATRTVEPIGEVPFRRRGTYDPSRRQDLGSRPARQGVEGVPVRPRAGPPTLLSSPYCPCRFIDRDPMSRLAKL